MSKNNHKKRNWNNPEMMSKSILQVVYLNTPGMQPSLFPPRLICCSHGRMGRPEDEVLLCNVTKSSSCTHLAGTLIQSDLQAQQQHIFHLVSSGIRTSNLPAAHAQTHAHRLGAHTQYIFYYPCGDLTFISIQNPIHTHTLFLYL